MIFVSNLLQKFRDKESDRMKHVVIFSTRSIRSILYTYVKQEKQSSETLNLKLTVEYPLYYLDENCLLLIASVFLD